MTKYYSIWAMPGTELHEKLRCEFGSKERPIIVSDNVEWQFAEPYSRNPEFSVIYESWDGKTDETPQRWGAR